MQRHARIRASDKEVHDFCTGRYGITFPQYSGIGREGNIAARYEPTTDIRKIRAKVEELLQMLHFDYLTENTCSKLISLDLDGNLVKNIRFVGGCDGNLKTIPVLLESWSVDQIEQKLSGIFCGRGGTSCSDQLAKAVRAALAASQDPNYKSPLEEDDDEE